MFAKIVQNISSILWGIPLVIMLVTMGIYLTFKFNFPQLKVLFILKDILKKKRKKPKEKKDNKKITSFKLLMTILAGTLGVGNITGVASAICIGGIGSMFWLFVSGFLSIAISYAENFIVLSNRKYSKHIGHYGGTMYVLDEILNKKGAAVFFSLMLVFATIGMGAMVQANSLATIAKANFNIDVKIVGIFLATISCYIIFGGKHRIAKMSSILVPICTIIYIGLCGYILYVNKENILPSIKDIVLTSFGAKQIIGGVTGISIIKIIGTGFSRGMFSNESGMGSAPIFASTVDDEDVEFESKVASFSVVIDTMFLCMLTGITIVSSGINNISNIDLILNNVFGVLPGGNMMLTICLIIFVIATIPCWEYYGEQGVKYLFNNNISTYLYRIIYPIVIYIGCTMVANVVWDLSSIANALMSIPNLYMIYKMTDG